MRQSLFLACAAALVLTGCQATGHSPYQYRFGLTQPTEVCLVVEPASAEGLSMQVQSVLKEKGIKVASIEDRCGLDCAQCVRFTAKMGDWVGSRIQSAKMEYSERSKGLRYTVSAENTSAMHAAFGAPIDDELVLIRSLVDQLFPNPIPWQD